MSDAKPSYFTLVFEGDLRKVGANPLTTETPFGTAFAAGIGNAFDQREDLADVHDELLAALQNALPFVARYEAEHESNAALEAYSVGQAAIAKATA